MGTFEKPCHVSINVDRQPRKYYHTKFIVVDVCLDYLWLVLMIERVRKKKMTDTKQVERNMQNIHASNEHSSYCECIWCLEKDTQLVGSSDLGKQEIEQEMAAMLKDLPLPITIKQQGDHYSDEYIWHCMGTTGKAYSFVDATRQALQSFIAISR
jgi:hypothetical protein